MVPGGEAKVADHGESFAGKSTMLRPKLAAQQILCQAYE